MAARAHRYEFTRPTWKGFFSYFGMVFGTTAFVSLMYKADHVRILLPIGMCRIF